jgi:hypothetical protein
MHKNKQLFFELKNFSHNSIFHMRVLSFDVAVKTLSYCILNHIPEVETQIDAWEIINVREEAQCTLKKTTAKEDCEMVMDALQRRNDVFTQFPLDTVIIENQPGSLNNRFSNMSMKTVSHAIHSYFYSLQHCIDGLGKDRAIVPVNFVSPNSKLTGMPKETEEDKAARQAGDRKAMGSKYKRNKAYAVEKTCELLESLDQDLESTQSARTTFDAASKQDDLADSCMLALAYCNKNTKKRKRSSK